MSVELEACEWAAPKITGNAHLLAGYIAAGLHGIPDRYRVDALQNPLLVINRETGNRFRVTVEQIGGVE